MDQLKSELISFRGDAFDVQMGLRILAVQKTDLVSWFFNGNGRLEWGRLKTPVTGSWDVNIENHN